MNEEGGRSAAGDVLAADRDARPAVTDRDGYPGTGHPELRTDLVRRGVRGAHDVLVADGDRQSELLDSLVLVVHPSFRIDGGEGQRKCSEEPDREDDLEPMTAAARRIRWLRQRGSVGHAGILPSIARGAGGHDASGRQKGLKTLLAVGLLAGYWRCREGVSFMRTSTARACTLALLIMVVAGPKATPRLPPRWFIRLFWITHRRLYRLTGGRLGLWRPKRNRWGAMRLTTVGRRTGLERSVMVGYFEDGPNLVTMAMNGWGRGRAGMVAQPAVPPRGTGRPCRRTASGHGPGRPRRGAGTAVVTMARDRQEPRRLRSPPHEADRSRHPGTAAVSWSTIRSGGG